jgi:hypothetical protein
MEAEELKASELLLDLGVSIPIRPLRFFSLKKKPKNIVLRRPYGGGLIRISRLYLKIGVTYNEMKEFDLDQNIRFIAEHGREAAEIVAVSILRGYLSFILFHRLIEWWLLWRVHPVFLSEAAFQMLKNTDIDPFKNIIKLANSVNLMSPRLSHEKSGS